MITISSEPTNLYYILFLCHFTEATAVNYYHMCLDQTGLKFKGDCLVDCMSIEQSTLGCKDTTRPVPPVGDERYADLWRRAPSLVMTSRCSPTGSDRPTMSALTRLHLTMLMFQH